MFSVVTGVGDVVSIAMVRETSVMFVTNHAV